MVVTDHRGVESHVKPSCISRHWRHLKVEYKHHVVHAPQEFPHGRNLDMRCMCALTQHFYLLLGEIMQGGGAEVVEEEMWWDGVVR